MGCNLKKSPQLYKKKHHLKQPFQPLGCSLLFFPGCFGLVLWGSILCRNPPDPRKRLGHGAMGHAGAVVDHALLGKFFFLETSPLHWMGPGKEVDGSMFRIREVITRIYPI